MTMTISRHTAGCQELTRVDPPSNDTCAFFERNVVRATNPMWNSNFQGHGQCPIVMNVTTADPGGIVLVEPL